MNTFKSLILLIGGALLLLPAVHAEEVVPVDKVESFVNVRAEPEAGALVIGRLHQGASYKHLGTDDGWRKVEMEDEVVGYISADWTNVVADTTADLEPAADAVAEEAAADAEPEAQVADEAVDDAVSDEVAEEAVVEEAVEAVVEEAAEAVAEEAVEEAVEDVVEEAVAEEAAEAVVELEEAPAEAAAASVQLIPGPPGPQGPQGPPGPPGPPGPAGAGGGSSALEGSENYVMKFVKPTIGGNSQIFDDGRNIGIGTTAPKQRLEVNGSIQIHEQNSSIAGLMITQSSGETGYIMHNRASTLTIGAGSVDRMTIDRAGNVGIGMTRPSHPLEMASGAHVTSGGVWTNSSSIANKENIETLDPQAALAALAALEPVLFNYKTDRDDTHVGFIAEDVPDLVATADRKGLSSMDIVAVLTRVVQLQQQRIEELEKRLDD